MKHWLRADIYTPLLSKLTDPQRHAFLRMCDGFAVSPGHMQITQYMSVYVTVDVIMALVRKGLCHSFDCPHTGQLKAVRL